MELPSPSGSNGPHQIQKPTLSTILIQDNSEQDYQHLPKYKDDSKHVINCIKMGNLKLLKLLKETQILKC